MLSKLSSSPQDPFVESLTAPEGLFERLLVPYTGARSTATPAYMLSKLAGENLIWTRVLVTMWVTSLGLAGEAGIFASLPFYPMFSGVPIGPLRLSLLRSTPQCIIQVCQRP